MTVMHNFLWGLLTMASAVAATFFLRYWRMTADRLFLLFALAFVAFAINWTALWIMGDLNEFRHHAYLPRLVGYVLIIVAIVDKNRHARSR